MEKNKNRTDLLAAGRKKLQQFRQKKDSKGSNSRSSGKAGKSGRETTLGTAPVAAVTEHHAADTERSACDLEDTIALLESGSRVDSVASDATATTDEHSAKTDGPEIASFAGAAEIPLEGSGLDGTPLNQTTEDGHDVVSGLSQEDRSSLIIDDAKYNVPGTSDTTILRENSVDSSIYLPLDSLSELGRQHGEDQVTDVGATQEVGNSSGNQIDEDRVTQLEGDGTLSSNELSKIPGDNKIADSGNTSAEEETNVATQLSKTDDASFSGSTTNDAEEAQEMLDDSVATVPLTESGLVSTLSPVATGQQREGLSSGSSNEEKGEMLIGQDGHGGSHIEGNQASSGFIEAQKFSELEINETAESLGCKQVDLSWVLDGSVIKLSQLAEILGTLDEDEFRFLCIARGSSLEKFKDTDKIKVHESVAHNAFERLKEQLYITSFSKDAFHLQLSEHQKSIDEICAVNASLIEVQDKNRIFAEEIVKCRNELQDVVSEREDLQKQLRFSNDEIEGLAARVNELQNKLEMAQQEMPSLSAELVDCKNLVETLQAANVNLNGSLKETKEEKIKLSEENVIVLLENEKMREELAESRASLDSLQTLQRDEQRQLEEQNDSMVHEKRKLIADCAEYKGTVESLEEENRNLNEALTSVSEERKKLEEEKVVLVQQIENRSRELMDCQELVVTLQTEISNLSVRLMSITEERNKLEEEKQNVFSEYENQSNELTQIKVLELSLQAERTKAVDDLKEAILRVKQLTVDNEALKADLDFRKLKLKEFDQKKYSSQFEEVANLGVENDASTLQRPKSDCSSLEQLKSDVHGESPAFVALKRNLEDAEIVMQKLEKEIEGMHSHLTSFSRSTDKVAAPGVSKLIEAFESKGHADDQEPEKHPSSENETTEEVYVRTKKLTENLRVMLKKLVDDTENASDFFRVQSKLLDAAVTDRSEYDSLREHTDQVEKANIELMVLYEVMKDHICHAVAREGELLVLCDALQKQQLVLKSENIQLREKLNEFQARISELQSQLDGICGDSDEVVAFISHQLLTLQAEVADRETILEEEWNSVSSQVLQTISLLDSTIKTFYANSSADEASNLDVVGRVAASVAGASKVIVDLQGQLEAAHKDREEISDKNDMALSTLNRIYNELNGLLSRAFGYQPDETESAVVNDKVLDLLHTDVLNNVYGQLRKLSDERLELQSENKQLNSELMSRAREIYDLEKKCLKSDAIVRLVEEIEQSLRMEGTDKDADEPASRLESLIYLLVQKYREAEQGLSLSTSLELQLNDLRGQVEHLNFLLVQYENENLVFKHSLKSAEEDVISLNYKVQEKVAELEQSEQRVLSLREKLSIAVTKGKGLISQRDCLRQSLAETSKELEKCSQELLSKDARLHELETKLKVYSEAGERMEALESELSYIRNSATALRESFLLKDSVLQRIEEILEDLDVPEHFHSRDIIEKIDWLAKSVGGNSMPQSDWDRRSSVGGGSDAGFVGGDGWTEDTQPNLNSADELRRRYEELQNKFYGLAEQNEMLEQSLMERNNLVQRWEEILDKVDMPSQLRSMEPENKIQWMESALSEAENHCHSLQQKIDTLETRSESLTADVEDSHRRTSELEAAFRQVCSDKEILSRDLEILSRGNDENLKKTADFKIRNENLQNEVSMLQEQKLRMEEDIHHTEHAIRRLQELVNDTLQDSCTEDEAFGQDGIKYFEEMLTKLIEKYKLLPFGKPVNIDPHEVHVTGKGELSHTSRDPEGQNVETPTEKLENSAGEMLVLKEQNDRYMLNNQSLLQKVEELEVKNKELQELLNQEELKSASFREKLNVAVRKGKSLVQQRDGMKQVIEELNAEVERLKSQIKHAEKAISEYEGQIKNLSTAQERVQIMESENIFLKDRLAVTERSLQEKEDNWSSVLDAFDDLDVGIAFNSGNPIEKLKEIGKHLHDLRSGVSSLEQESRKSKRAAELLLAELNEVQERNDSLQEELANAVGELTGLSRERDLAENAKYEALARVEKLSHIYSEEKDRHLSEIMALKSGVDNMREDLSAIDRELREVLSKDLEIIHHVKAMMKSFLDSGATPDLIASFPGGVISIKSENKVFMTEIGSLREQLHKHSRLLQEEASQLSEVVMNVLKEYASQKESYESIKKDIEKLELVEKEKESELHILRGNASLLYETFASAISEIEHLKDHAVGNDVLASRAPERNLNGGDSFTNDIHAFSKEGIRGMRDKLSLGVREFISMQSNLLEVGQREMKSTVLNLQKELQEKDIQRERICMELVNQIKEAENNAKNYLHDLEQVRLQLHASQRQLNVMEEERNVLEQRIKELLDQETKSIDLQQKVNSLTDALTAKVQETEALMQALEEQEAEVEDLANKIVGLENELQQKNRDMENLESSRAKALKKLSITVSKFDELHYLSESLLSEVERLQSQLQERDGEISFLRQEVTRCTNDALSFTQMNKKRRSDEIHELLAWLDSLISPVYVHDVASDDSKSHLVDEYKEVLQKKILNLISDLENLRVVVQNSDRLLQEERSKVEELKQKEQYLKNSLHEKESQLIVLQSVGDSANATKSTSEIMEVEQMSNKWASTGNIAPQVRSLRKTNNDQVAIAIDVDQSSDRLEDDDDKAHGFKSLTTSRIVPRFTRPLSDMVDGLWVSCDRALMRQPALRLSVIIYWVMLHAMLATFVV